jgi:uncharacterized membrane protein YeaQ/YmgE (transglycosylase-associated protein family)
MALIVFIVFGFVIGLIARALMPGRQPMGYLMTIGLGVAGSFLGGILVSVVTSREITDFHTAGVIGSLVGALALLLVASGFRADAPMSETTGGATESAATAARKDAAK